MSIENIKNKDVILFVIVTACIAVFAIYQASIIITLKKDLADQTREVYALRMQVDGLKSNTDSQEFYNRCMKYFGNQGYPMNFYCKLFIGEIKSKDE